MFIQSNYINNTIYLKLSGFIDNNNLDVLRKKIQSIIEKHYKLNIKIDMYSCSYIDCFEFEKILNDYNITENKINIEYK